MTVLTHVWMVYNSPTDIHLFSEREHVVPSIKLSYHAIPGTTFKELSGTGMDVHVEVTRGNEMITETIIARCLPVWKEPCHL